MVRGSKEIMDIVNKESLPICKYCGEIDEVVRFGYSRNEVQRYWCKRCKRAFLDNDALPRMRVSVRQLGSILGQYYGGMSLKSIRRQFEQQHQVSPSRSSVYRWLSKFTKIAVNEAKKYTPNVGDVWIADETALNIGGSHKVWFWDIIDAKTRFLLASHISTKRTTADALTLMKLAEQRAGKVPQLVFTDKLQAYTDGIELAFGADTKHIPSKGFVAPMNTNMIERFHGTLKDRTKVMRGLKNIRTAKLLLDGWLVHYNFFRPHEALKGKTPAEKAGIKFSHRNWLDLVKSQAHPEQETEGDKSIQTIRASPAPASYRRKHTHKAKSRKPKRARQAEPKLATARALKGIR